MAVDGRPVKRAKRRVTADLLDFSRFAIAGDEASGGLDGPFRQNVREFLARHARAAPPPAPIAFPHLLTWRITFGLAGEEGEEAAAVVELDVVEEDVERSRNVYCDQCRVAGWSSHPVCGKRYHFIVRNDDNSMSCNQIACSSCGILLQLSATRCPSCDHEITANDLEDWVYYQLENPLHLLHGVVHANGYGHLLRVNGREGGSKYLKGYDLMGFWDRLCKFLKVRKVTVMDVSRKYGMEYRLLHAVTTGHSWYGNWGYQFGTGSFALTAESYQIAVNVLSSMQLYLFSYDRSRCTQLHSTISFYCSLSKRQLVTVKDLFCYMTRLLHDDHEQRPAKKLENDNAEESCPWTVEDIQRATNVILKVLRAVDRSRWVTSRALRGATYSAIGSPQLLDYCLKRLGGTSTDDGMAVVVRCNTEGRVIEYRLESASHKPSAAQHLDNPSTDQVLHDLKFLYNALLNPEMMQPFKPLAVWESARSSAGKLLDCKQFIKHYDMIDDWLASNPFVLQIWCRVELDDKPWDYTAPPAELLFLPRTATVADVKLEAIKAFQETYLIFQSLQIEHLSGYKGLNDNTEIKVLPPNGVVQVRGRCFGSENRLEQFRMERGTENWTVTCACGAKDDDGERMLACDLCGIWQHTRCSGINDFDEVPDNFVCRSCNGFSEPSDNKIIVFRESNPHVRCQHEVMLSITKGKHRKQTSVN